jgi:hypothetical protein
VHCIMDISTYGRPINDPLTLLPRLKMPWPRNAICNAICNARSPAAQVDLDWVAEGARLAAAGSAKHFALCSSMGANANVWACDWIVSAPLLYMKVKGQAEEAVKVCLRGCCGERLERVFSIQTVWIHLIHSSLRLSRTASSTALVTHCW